MPTTGRSVVILASKLFSPSSKILPAFFVLSRKSFGYTVILFSYILIKNAHEFPVPSPRTHRKKVKSLQSVILSCYCVLYATSSKLAIDFKHRGLCLHTPKGISSHSQQPENADNTCAVVRKYPMYYK